MKFSSINLVNDSDYEVLGLVKGSTVQTRNALRDGLAGFKNIIGGEIKTYSDMLEKARVISENRMIEEAEKFNADEIIGVSYITNSFMDGCIEFLVYGTAIMHK